MLDMFGFIAFTAIAVMGVGALILAGARGGAARSGLALVAAAWFALIVSFAAAGLFARSAGVGTLAIGAAVVTPVILGLIGFARSQAIRGFAQGIPLDVLVGVHAGRLLGVFFLGLYATGRLPATFALAAGWGDIFVGATALPLAWAVRRRVAGWRSLTWAWNTIGTFDLVNAVALGVGSADSPLRFIFERPDSGAIGTLPWVLIPGFLVPVYLLTHLTLYARLAGATKAESLPLRRAA